MVSAPPFALVATDLDGTLLRRGDTVSARSRAALARVSAAGAQHIVVTGRPAPQVRHLLMEMEYGGLAVCGQGAQVFDAGAGRLVSALTLDRELAELALGKIEAEVGEVFAAVNQDGMEGLMLMEPGYEPSHRGLPAVRVGLRAALWDEPINKVLVRHPSLGDDELVAVARAVTDGLVTMTMAGPGIVELQPLGVTKATGLAIAAEMSGIPAERTITFGDMPNDIPMFDWSGYGVAMANAHEELKAVADEVTASNEADGVAAVLERLYA
ncbi:HAD family hydrolase [Streptomyces sp. Da 82-17]|uniref:HAD family hydrolase n=1 Tax=Streptomyces sp. Da 82-17 TaxID=3377116 RepID=UPI0038D50A04